MPLTNVDAYPHRIGDVTPRHPNDPPPEPMPPPATEVNPDAVLLIQFAAEEDRENSKIHLTLQITQPGGLRRKYPFTTELRGNRLHFLFQILAEARKYASVPESRHARLLLDVRS